MNINKTHDFLYMVFLLLFLTNCKSERIEPSEILYSGFQVDKIVSPYQDSLLIKYSKVGFLPTNKFNLFVAIEKSIIKNLFKKYGQNDSVKKTFKYEKYLSEKFLNHFEDSLLHKEVIFCSNLNNAALEKKIKVELYYHEGSKNIVDSRKKALEYFKEAIVLANEIGDVKRKIDCYSKLPYIYLYEDQRELSIKTALKLIKEAHRFKYYYREAWARYSLVSTYFELGEYKKASTHLDSGLTAALSVGDPNLISSIYERIGLTANRMGNLNKAYNAYATCLGYLKDRTDVYVLEDSLRLLIGLSNVLKNLGQYSDAKKVLIAGLSKSKLISDSLFRSTFYMNLGELYARIDELDVSLKMLKKAYKIRKKIDNQYRIAEMEYKIGTTFYFKSLTDSALYYFNKAQYTLSGVKEFAQVFKRLEADIFFDKGNYYFTKNNYNEAKYFYSKSKKLAQSISYSEVDILAGIFLGKVSIEKKQYNSARILLSDALQEAKENKDPYLLAIAYFNLGLYYKKTETPVKAEELLLTAINLSEQTRAIQNDFLIKINYYATVQNIFNELINLYIQSGQKEKAFYYSELSRARLLLDIKPEIDIGFDNLKNIGSKLDNKSVIIEYKITNQNLITFVVSNKSIHFVKQDIPRNILNKKIIEFLGAIGSKNYSLFKKKLKDKKTAKNIYKLSLEAGKDLYSVLIQPIENLLIGKGSLHFSPDGILHNLPFASLLKNDSTFLIQNYTIDYLPSVFLRTNIQIDNPENNSFLGIANTSGDLPYSEFEVQSISKIFKNNYLMLGSRQKENLVHKQFQNGYKIIHVATHALINEQQPLLSYIPIAPATSKKTISTFEYENLIEDNKLMAFEIMKFDMNSTHLVCLATCKGASGKFYSGEGVLGITHAFMIAGAQSVLTTLWNVDDKFTSELLILFYNNWITNKLSKAEALRLAQLQIIENSRDSKIIKYPFIHSWAALKIINI
ncbi:MAG: CHAT domain-containing protein [Calditrichaeota bacterium]|nr:CHAT domain-containing protein [Calditrichota bacterium]